MNFAAVRSALGRRFSVAAVPNWFAFGAMTVYVLFPLVNLFRRAGGSGPFLFSAWRDYVFWAAGIFLVLLLIAAVDHPGREKLVGAGKTFLANPAFVFLAALAVWMIVSTAVTGFVYASVVGSEKSRTGLICSLVYLTVFLMGLRLKKTRGVGVWLGVFLAAAGLINLLILVDYFFGLELDLAGNGPVFYNRNHLAYYLLTETVAAAAVFLLSPSKGRRAAAMVVYFTGVEVLIIADTLGCLVALVLTFVFAAVVLPLTRKFHPIRYAAVLLAAAAAFACLWFIPDAKGVTQEKKIENNITVLEESAGAITDIGGASGSLGSGRMALWKSAVRATVEKPVFGQGLAAMRVRLSEDTNGGNDTVHNEFLEYASNHGVPALLFYLAFVLAVFIRGARCRRSLTDTEVLSLTVAFAYLVSSFFGVTMFYTAPYLFLFLGLGYCRPEKAA